MEQRAARILRECTAEAVAASSSSLAGVARYRLDAGHLHRLDGELLTTASRPLPVQDEATLLDATANLRMCAVSVGGELVLVTDVSRFLGVPRVASATFVADRLVVAARPEPRPSRPIQEDPRQGDFDLLLFSVPDGRRLDRTTLPIAGSGGVLALTHPTDTAVLLEAPYGQDGTDIFLVRCGDRLDVTPVLEDVVMSSFSEGGDRLLCTPHESFDPPDAKLFAWPRLDPVASLASDNAGMDADAPFSLHGCFVGKHIILLTCTGRLVLCDDSLVPLGEVTLPGDGLIEALSGLGPRTFAVSRRETNASRSLICDLGGTEI